MQVVFSPLTFRRRPQFDCCKKPVRLKKPTDKEGMHQAVLLCIYQLNHCKALLDIHCLPPSVLLLQKQSTKYVARPKLEENMKGVGIYKHLKYLVWEGSQVDPGALKFSSVSHLL